MNSGVYCITNLVSGWRYFGSASDFARRWSKHRWDLENGQHQNEILQRSWVKHGSEAFSFEVIERCEVERLLEVEQGYLDANWGQKLYNRRRLAHNNLGVTHTDEARDRMRAAWSLTPGRIEARDRQAASKRGRKHTAEHCAKISAANRNRTQSEETRARMSELAANRPAEHLAKIADSLSREWLVTSPEGEEIEVVNLTAWAKDRDLLASKLYAVAAGRRAHHKGWKCIPLAKRCVSTDAAL